MRPSTLKLLLLLLALPTAGLCLALLLQQRADLKLRASAARLAQQDVQLAGLLAQGEQLSNRLAQVASSAAAAPEPELPRLRAGAQQLRQQVEALGKSLEASRAARKLLGCSSLPPGYEYTPEQWHQREQLSAGKEQDAEKLHWAFWDYYLKHHEQFPSSLDQLRPYLEERHIALTGTNAFELIYPGPQDGLTNFPTQMLAVLRERQPWRAPSGRWARVYGMLTVPPRVVESDDDFQSWEAEHIIPPPGERN